MLESSGPPHRHCTPLQLSTAVPCRKAPGVHDLLHVYHFIVGLTRRLHTQCLHVAVPSTGGLRAGVGVSTLCVCVCWFVVMVIVWVVWKGGRGGWVITTTDGQELIMSNTQPNRPVQQLRCPFL